MTSGSAADGRPISVRDPDRLLPADAGVRAIARQLLERVETLPIISPHGHVSPRMIADNVPFANPAELLITSDHYLTRLLHATGVPLDRLGLGETAASPREIWRVMCENWSVFAATATGYWMAESLAGVFGIDEDLSAATADDTYDAISERLATPAFRPRALMREFGIQVLATTDDPLDSLNEHRLLQSDGFEVLPTFRPDGYLDPLAHGFVDRVTRLIATHQQPATFDGYLRSLEERRRYFRSRGAVSADHGVVDPTTLDLEPEEAESLFQRTISLTATPDDARRFLAHMLLQMARMSVEDGLVMTLHPGVHRNHSSSTLRRFGPDTGHDIPVPTSFVQGLRPLLERYGLEPEFHLILFTVDETTYSREIAPLAGFYPSVFIGAPWWFLDAPDAITRFRSAVTETAGFYRGSGFIDDTRAFLSIPARHNTARRVDAGYLARLVSEGRLSVPTAEQIIEDLTVTVPRKAFKL